MRQATPEKTMLALMEDLPRRYWVEINRLLVPFGKHVCTGAKMPAEALCGTSRPPGPAASPHPFLYFAGGPGESAISEGLFLAGELASLRRTCATGSTRRSSRPRCRCRSTGRSGLTTALVESGTTEGLDISCLARMRRPDFALPR